MYYSGGNYEAFSSPGAGNVNESGKVYIIGSGMAALSAACFLIRDGGMPGERIHILEKNLIPGGGSSASQEHAGYAGVSGARPGGKAERSSRTVSRQ